MADGSAPARSGVQGLFGHGSVYVLALAVQASAGFLVLPVLTRMFSPSEYGTVATALVILQLLSVAASLGLPAALTLQFFANERDRGTTRQLTTLAVGCTFAVTAIVDLLGPLWVEIFSSVTYSGALRVAVWTAAPVAASNAVKALLQAAKRPWAFLTVTLTGAAGGQALGLLFVAVLEPEPVSYFLGNALGVVVATVLGVKWVGLGIPRRKQRRLLLQAFKVGLPTLPMNLGVYLTWAGDRVVIERLLGLEAVGRYQLAYLVGAVGILAGSAISSAWIPIILGANDDERPLLLADTAVILHRLSALAAGGLAIGGPTLLTAFAPASYEPAALATVTAVVASGTIPYVTMLSRFIRVFQVGRTAYLGWVFSLSAVLNIGLNLALVPHTGLVGSAIATTATFAAQAWLLDRGARDLESVPWHNRSTIVWWAIGLLLCAIGGFLPAASGWLVARLVGAVAVGALAVFVGWSARLGELRAHRSMVTGS